MSQSAKAQEPSMEEILASIRRIIADDESTKPPAKPAPPPPSAPQRPAAAAPNPAPPTPAPPPAAEPAEPPSSMNQHAVDAMLAGTGTTRGGGDAERDQQDILELTDSMAASEPAPDLPSFQTIDGQPDVVFSDGPASEPVPRVLDEARRQYTNAAPDRSLLSNATAAAVDSAFNTLAQTVLVHNARTLEDLVREMLRPMLKSWLDDNLPSMVERIVKAEIERVSRGRG
jgi:cell pole-organizing protein PopZ